MSEIEKLKKFARDVLHCTFDGFEVESEAIQAFAIDAGLLVQTGYDPEKHGPNDVDAEPGDPWYEFAGSLARRKAP